MVEMVVESFTEVEIELSSELPIDVALESLFWVVDFSKIHSL